MDPTKVYELIRSGESTRKSWFVAIRSGLDEGWQGNLGGATIFAPALANTFSRFCVLCFFR